MADRTERPAMGGAVLLGTAALDRVVEFYADGVGASVWLEQPDATILTRDGFRFGFREREPAEPAPSLAFFEPYRGGVDAAYERLADHATGPPNRERTRATYGFSARDPDGRTVEVTTFL